MESTINFGKLEELKENLKSKRNLIHLKGYFHLTKTEKNYSEAVLFRDQFLEVSVSNWMEQRRPYDEVMRRYAAYDHTLNDLAPPQHYPVRIVAGEGSICSGSNIFMFFPEVLGLPVRDSSDVMGFEFVDVWSNIFEKAVFPCAERVFEFESIYKFATPLKLRLAETIYLASIFHEVGHRCGPWKVSPFMHPSVGKHKFGMEIMAELATDTQLVLNLQEYPEIAAFVVLQRLFWFSRRGFKDNPMSGYINKDNDAWIGAYLWKKLIRNGAVLLRGERFAIDSSRVVEAFTEVLQEIDEVGNTVIREDDPRALAEWLDNSVERIDGQWILPRSFKLALSKCQDIPETPHFSPLTTVAPEIEELGLVHELERAL